MSRLPRAKSPGARRVDEPQYRHLMGRVFNLIVRVLAIPGIQDTQCGFKVFRREVARDVFALQTIDGWGFDVEVLFIALKHGYKLIEVPITWYYRPQSRISPLKDSINMVLEVLKVRRNGWRGLYDRKNVIPPCPIGPRSIANCTLIRSGHALVAGIDEAGRGAWAGPVVAAAVILNLAGGFEPATGSMIPSNSRRANATVCIRSSSITVSRTASARAASRRSIRSGFCRPPAWP